MTKDGYFDSKQEFIGMAIIMCIPFSFIIMGIICFGIFTIWANIALFFNDIWYSRSNNKDL